MLGLLVAENHLECGCGIRATIHDFSKQDLVMSIDNDDMRFEHRFDWSDGRSDDLGIPAGLAHGHVEPGVSFVACAWTHYGDYNSVSLHLFDDRRDPSPRFVIPGTGEFRPVRFVEFNEYFNGTLRYAEWTEGYPSAPIGEWLVEGKHTLLRRTVLLVVTTGEIAGTELQPFLTAPNVRDMKLDGERWVPAYPDLYPGGWAEPPAPPPALEKPYLPIFGGTPDPSDDTVEGHEEAPNS